MKKFLILLSFLFVVTGAHAWVEPTLAPPNGNVTAPLRLDSNGRLGIGVSNPGKKFEIVGEVVPRASSGTGAVASSLASDSFGANLWVNSAYDPANPNSGWARAMTLTPSGNIGVGVTSPNEKFELASTAASGGRMIVSDGGGASRKVVLTVSPSATSNFGRIESYDYGASTGLPLYINSSGNGNVSIGPLATTYKLNVNGDVNIPTGSCYRVNGTCISSGTLGGSGTTNYLTKFTAASTLGDSQLFDNGTNVGVGTASPGTKLEVYDASLNPSLFTVTAPAGSSAGTVARIRSGSNSSGTKLLSIDYGPSYASNALTVLANGNVGVGVTSPSANLDVAGVVSVNTNADAVYAAYIRNTHLNGNGITGEGGIYGVRGLANNGSGSGVYGQGASGSAARGVVGAANEGTGVYGLSGFSYGVYCQGASCGGNRAWTNTSDVRLKKNISTITDGLDKILKLRGVKFNWKDGDTNTDNIGFIAQEVLEVVPEVVKKNPDGYYAINESSMTAVLVEAVKELKAENDDLKARLEKLEAKIK